MLSYCRCLLITPDLSLLITTDLRSRGRHITVLRRLPITTERQSLFQILLQSLCIYRRALPLLQLSCNCLAHLHHELGRLTRDQRDLIEERRPPGILAEKSPMHAFPRSRHPC